jgi:ABC-type phosphate transport system substrate-binding protein
MRKGRGAVRTLLVTSVLAAGSLVGASGPLAGSQAGAATDPTTLDGQGGSFLQPVVSKLINDDTANLSPLYGAYLPTDLNAGISAFVGSGPDQFSADYAVSERPLTPTESAQAKADGRSYAYVPFASTPVAVGTLVPTAAWGQSGSGSITPSGFCQHMPMSTTLLGQIFGLDSSKPLQTWEDPRVTCPAVGGGTVADSIPISLWANLDPSMANYAMMALLDSTPSSQALFAAGLAGAGSLTTSTTPSTNWPYAQNTYPGGDQPLIGKLLAINPQTNVPSATAVSWRLGATVPISSVWTGSPLGVPWNISTAAVQNAQGSYVPPSAPAAKAAAADSTLAVTPDPTTNNLVTFNASTSDAGAYNDYLMVESYLVVPTNGLPANKSAALAQFVRFVLGPQGEQDIQTFGAAPATPSEQAAGLEVAAELNAAAVAGPSPAASGATTTTTTTAATGTTTAPGGTTGSDTGSTGSGTGSSGSSGGATDTSGGLAFTGASHLGVWVGAGAALFLIGTVLRRRLRRPGVQS